MRMGRREQASGLSERWGGYLAVWVSLTCDRNQTSLICAAQCCLVSDFPLLFVSSSSPKSKQEVMVRPPTVMSPSGNPQLDSKFSNQGKQGGSTSQSQPSPCDSKSGGHTPKALPGPGGSMGLKNGAGNGAKGKGKRERSISADSFDQRDPGPPNDDSDMKGMSIRSLRLRGK